MGCDIHSMVEVKEKRYEGSWGRGERIAGLWDQGSERWVGIDDDLFPRTWGDKGLRSAPLDDRNYDLFALLANVRNGYGFAGTPRGVPIEPLSPPRGVPDDASFAWLAEVDSWSVDMHSHSWFTLAELVEWRDAGRLTPPVQRIGVISVEQYEALRDNGVKPDDWSGDISGYGIATITPEEYESGHRGEVSDRYREYMASWKERATDPAELARLEEAEAAGITKLYIRATWADTYADSVKELTNAIAALERYAADLPPEGEGDEPGWHGRGPIPHENIRIVFGFDN